MYLFDRVVRGRQWHSGNMDQDPGTGKLFFGTVIQTLSDNRALVAWDHTPTSPSIHEVSELGVTGRNPFEYLDALMMCSKGGVPAPAAINEGADPRVQATGVYVAPYYGMPVVRGPQWKERYKGDLNAEGQQLPGNVIEVLPSGQMVKVRWANEKSAVYHYSREKMEVMPKVE